MEKPKQYLFILRAWHEGADWRWSLLRTGESDRLGFPDLDSLYLHLAALTAEPKDMGDRTAHTPQE